jgi:UDP-N-acetylmuramyl pentapeptide phosphotransferase/UDP-N-acetylglucosamine-1-phosphate transferase
MHDGATIRGGGIVIFLGMAICSVFFHYPGDYFIIGLAAIGITGFLDDLLNLPGAVRLLAQILAVVLILMQLDLLNLPILWIALIIIIAAGVINAFNFMDGINGITAGYSLVFVLTLVYINYKIQAFIDVRFLYGYFLALLVFAYFNFRKKAVCFAGDVGSLTIAFINVFLLLKLMSSSGQILFIFLFTLYGMDTIFTILQRLYKRENIFKPHKMHFFQVVVSHTNVSQLQMTVLYIILQLLINAVILVILQVSVLAQVLVIIGILMILSILYISVKVKVMKKYV